MARQKPKFADARNLIAQLSSSSDQCRSEAERQLAQQELNTVEHLRLILAAEHRRRRKQRRPLEAVRWILFLLFSLPYCLRAGHLPGIGMTIFLTLFPGFCISILKYNLRNRFNRGMAVALSRLDDVRLIAPLLEVYFGSEQELVEPALTRLLPRLQASDAPLLREYHRSRLYTKLSLCCGFAARTVDVRFILATLKALEQIGDEKAIKPVEKVAAKAKNRLIREAATDCLEFLRAREARGEFLLLRASDISPKDLLRPVEEAEISQSGTLLRTAPSAKDF